MKSLYVEPRISKQFYKILHEEGLFNFYQFFKSSGPKELPLFSRDSQVNFLMTLSDIEIDIVLIKLALSYLERVILNMNSSSNFLAAITFLECDEGRLLIPHIFVYTGSIQEILNSIELEETSTLISQRLIKALHSIGLNKQFDVLNDFSTIAECARIFVGHKDPLKTSMISIHACKKTFSSSSSL